MIDLPLHVIHLNQDDPRKCTARALERRGHAILHYDAKYSPKRGVLLDPNSGVLLGPDDRVLMDRGAAIVALDCSWKQLNESLSEISRINSLNHRTLPMVLAANPVSWGKPGRLSTAEALCVSLILLGRWEQARSIIRPFGFGDQFLSLNHEPLKAYSLARTNSELAQMQWEFFDMPDSTDD